MSTVSEQAAAMAEEIQTKVTDRSMTWLAAENIGHDPMTPTERDAFEAGVAAGFMHTLLVLQEMGILPNPAAREGE